MPASRGGAVGKRTKPTTASALATRSGVRTSSAAASARRECRTDSHSRTVRAADLSSRGGAVDIAGLPDRAGEALSNPFDLRRVRLELGGVGAAPLEQLAHEHEPFQVKNEV